MSEPITVIPRAPPADPRKVALGERLFADHRLSHGGARACSSCHDVSTNGAGEEVHTTPKEGSAAPLNVPTVFNAALSFRLNWEGDVRPLEAQAEASLADPAGMASSIAEVLSKLNADPQSLTEFGAAYGRPPDRANLLDAIATYERSLLTTGSRFDIWLGGDPTALTAQEEAGYGLFKSLGCISCHQGVNVGGNLYQRHGIFRPLASPLPEILRRPEPAERRHDGALLP